MSEEGAYPTVVCADCNRPMPELVLAAKDERFPCPGCGSTNIAHSRVVHDSAPASDYLAYSANVALPNPGWREQWNRVLREQKLLGRPIEGPINRERLVEDRDTYIHFFQDLHHFKDWLKNDPSSPITDAEAVVKDPRT